MKNRSKDDNAKQKRIVRIIQFSITIVAIIIALTHFIWPKLTIDAITIVLLVIAIVPWLAPLFKSIEFPGGWKIEFQEVQDLKDKADEAGLLVSASEVHKPEYSEAGVLVSDSEVQRPEYSFQLVAKEDPNLALAGLRIEIEKRLNKIAEVNNIVAPRESVGHLLRLLGDRNILNNNERSVLADITGLLNSAVHGASVDVQTSGSALEMGSRLLKGLDEKIEVAKVEK